MMRLKDKYQKEVIPQLKEKLGYKNTMAVPRILKVVLNTGFGRQVVGKSNEEQKKIVEATINDLTTIAGQKAVGTRSKGSIAAFKTRQGMVIGACVTLRGQKMYDFIERLIHIALPRSRDFQGLSPKSVDKTGNLTIAIKETISFSEISPEKSKSIFGLEITVVTNAKKHEAGLALFRALGFPIKQE